MFCQKCGCYIPMFSDYCPACEAHKSLTKNYDIIRFKMWGAMYECQITTMHENKDGTVSFRMKTIQKPL